MSYEHYEIEQIPCINFEKCKQTVDRVKRSFEKPRITRCERCKAALIRENMRLRTAAYNKMFPLKKFHSVLEKYKKPGEPMTRAYKRFLKEKI